MITRILPQRRDVRGLKQEARTLLAPDSTSPRIIESKEDFFPDEGALVAIRMLAKMLWEELGKRPTTS
jgi:hypothetical protein